MMFCGDFNSWLWLWYLQVVIEKLQLYSLERQGLDLKMLNGPNCSPQSPLLVTGVKQWRGFAAGSVTHFDFDSLALLVIQAELEEAQVVDNYVDIPGFSSRWLMVWPSR